MRVQARIQRTPQIAIGKDPRYFAIGVENSGHSQSFGVISTIAWLMEASS